MSSISKRATSLLLFGGVLALHAQDSAALARQVIDNETRQLRDFAEYTFAYQKVSRFPTKAGTPGRELSERGETYMSHRRNTDIALERDGKPLKPKDLEKVRKAAIKRLEADFLERQSPAYKERPLAEKRGAGFTRNGIHMSVIDVLRYCRLAPVRAEAARLAIPYSACKSPWPEESHYVHLQGTVWIDKQLSVVDSWEALTPSGKVFFEQTTQLAPGGGSRLPHTWRLDCTAAHGFFSTERFELLYRWTNPQRFQVDVQQTIAEPDPK